MALALSFSEKQDFFVGTTCVVVKTIVSKSLVILAVGDTEFEIRDTRATEIMPGVFVSLGKADMARTVAKIVFQAPPQVIILRGDKYRRFADAPV